MSDGTSDDDDEQEVVEEEHVPLLRLLQSLAARGRLPRHLMQLLGAGQAPAPAPDPLAGSRRRVRLFHPEMNMSAAEREQLARVERTPFGHLVRRWSAAGSPAHVVASVRKRRRVGLRPTQLHSTLTSSLVPNVLDRQILPPDDDRGRVYTARFSPLGSLFATALQGSKILLLDPKREYAVVRAIEARRVRWTVSATAFSPDERLLAYSSLHPVLHLCSTQADTVDRSDGDEGRSSARRRRTDLRSSSTSSTSSTSSSSPSASLTKPVPAPAPPPSPVPSLVRRDLHEEVSLASPRQGEDDAFAVYDCKWSAGGREIVAACSDGRVRVVDVERKVVLVSQAAHASDVNAACFVDEAASPHLLASGSDDWTVKIWDRRTMGRAAALGPAGGAELVLRGHLGGVTSIDARGDGFHILSNSKDQTVKVWDIRAASSLPPGYVPPRALGRRFAFDYRWESFPGRGAPSWHPDDASVLTCRGHVVQETLIHAGFSPRLSTGGRYIYSGSAGGAVCVWDALSGQLVRTLRMPDSDGAVRDVSWHPTLPVIIASSFDGFLAVFRADTDAHRDADAVHDDEGEELAPLAVGLLPSDRTIDVHALLHAAEHPAHEHGAEDEQEREGEEDEEEDDDDDDDDYIDAS